MRKEEGKQEKRYYHKVLEAKLVFSEKIVISLDTEFIEQEKTTDTTGRVEFTQLLIGKYRITEVKAPQGYELAKESIEVEITKENANQQIEAKDKLKLILPETGAKNYTIIISLFGAIVMLLSFILIILSPFNNPASLAGFVLFTS